MWSDSLAFLVLLEYEDTRAIVRERYLENKVIIKLEGTHKKEFLSIIRKTIQEINNEYNNIEVNEMIPCNCIECKTSSVPYFYKYVTLRRYQQREIPEIRCEKSLLNINLKSLFTDSILDPSETIVNNSNTTTMSNVNIKIENNNTNQNNLSNNISIEITSEIQVSINGLISDLNNLKDEMLETCNPVEKELIDSEFKKIDASVKNLEDSKNKNDIDKTKLSKIKTFLDKLSDSTSKINEVFKKVEHGFNFLKNLAKYYNSIAEWTGLPQVPRILTK